MRLFCGYAADWRRGRDSNPCALSRKLISSQPRYDHFDTSPDMCVESTTDSTLNIISYQENFCKSFLIKNLAKSNIFYFGAY